MLSLALVAGMATAQQPQSDEPKKHPELDAAEQFITEHVAAAETRKHLKRLTETPHVAGSPEALANALYVKSTLEEFGFETAIAEYQALLPYPKKIALRLTAPEEFEFDLRELPNDRDAYSHDDTAKMRLIQGAGFDRRFLRGFT